MIVGQNALLNQYVPTFCLKNLQDGQGIVYDSVRKAFVNIDIGTATGGATRLGELLDVNSSVDNPLSVQNGQALVYNSLTSLWENQFVDYNTLVNPPDLSVTLTGDVTGTGTGTIATTLATITTAGTYGDDHFVPTITVNEKGLVTAITTQHVDTTVRDLVPETETFVVSPRHQYIVTSVLEVEGMIENYGVIAIL